MLRLIGVTCALYARRPSGRPIGRENPPMNRTSIAAGIAAASALALLAPAQAFAAPPIIDHWSDHVEHIEQVEHEDWCPDVPFDVLYTDDASGTFRFVRHGDGNYYGGSSITSNFSWTNVETGKTFSGIRHGSDKDLLVTDNGDGTVTIEVQSTGPTTYYDDDGNRLFMDVGRQTGTLLIDTNGTPSDPSDDEFVSFVPGESTAHFETADRDFCADIMEFIG